MFDVAIIGAGVTGSSIARELSRYTCSTVLVDKDIDVSFGTSKANSGIIHGGFHSAPGTLKSRLCVHGNRLFDQLAEELGFPFKRCGALVVAFTDEEFQYLQHLLVQGKKNNVQYLSILGKEQTLAHEPHLNEDVLGALYSPTAGIIGPYEYCFSLAENARLNGVVLHNNFKVAGVRKKSGGFDVVSEDGNTISSRYVINAAGMYADVIAEMVSPGEVEIHPRKGEEYLLDKRLGALVNHVVFPVPAKNSKGMLIIPTVDGPVMVGPTAEDVSDKEDVSTSREGLAAVFDHAKKLMPEIKTSDIITSFAGIRPVSRTNDFILDQSNIAGFFNAAGIQSPGLTASPAIALHMVELLNKAGLDLVRDPSFNPSRRVLPRVRELIDTNDIDGLKEIVGKDIQFADLVCRCEHVTRGEVLSAIERGHSSLDGIKFSTRAMSGRCQGGFCTHRILSILDEVAGIPYEKASKRGGGTFVFDKSCKLEKGGKHA